MKKIIENVAAIVFIDIDCCILYTSIIVDIMLFMFMLPSRYISTDV